MKKIKEPFSEEEQEERRTLLLRGWIIVSAIALGFVIYGLFAFFVIGDNQPPDWDFGAVRDVPGESIYSTYPYHGGSKEPEPQHVDQKPLDAASDTPDSTLSAPVERNPESHKVKQEAESGQCSVQQGQQPDQPGTK
jgi:hypothetical protein